ncbi:MAG: borealin N-terminal domain-containing protein [archaeon]|nr:borealin N-terminal domain-containing protein [archaeon]
MKPSKKAVVGPQIQAVEDSDLQLRLLDFDCEVEERCSEMEATFLQLASSMRLKVMLEMQKMPVALRTMPMARFAGEFNGDISQAIKGLAIEQSKPTSSSQQSLQGVSASRMHQPQHLQKKAACEAPMALLSGTSVRPEQEISQRIITEFQHLRTDPLLDESSLRKAVENIVENALKVI